MCLPVLWVVSVVTESACLVLSCLASSSLVLSILGIEALKLVCVCLCLFPALVFADRPSRRTGPDRKQAVYSACYAPAKEIMQECYNEVRSGNEIRSVVMQGARLNEINTGKIDGTFTWKASFWLL